MDFLCFPWLGQGFSCLPEGSFSSWQGPCPANHETEAKIVVCSAQQNLGVTATFRDVAC